MREKAESAQLTVAAQREREREEQREVKREREGSVRACVKRTAAAHSERRERKKYLNFDLN